MYTLSVLKMVAAGFSETSVTLQLYMVSHLRVPLLDSAEVTFEKQICLYFCLNSQCPFSSVVYVSVNFAMGTSTDRCTGFLYFDSIYSVHSNRIKFLIDDTNKFTFCIHQYSLMSLLYISVSFRSSSGNCTPRLKTY